jgi:hypothetical protein
VVANIGLIASFAITIVYVRVISTISRWIALGPGRAATRGIVGTFLLSMLYALFIGMRFPYVGGSLALDDMAWIAYPILFLLTGWTAVAALGERDVICDRHSPRKSFGLRDALLALALFGIVAAAFRFAIGPAGVDRSIDTYTTDVLCWGPILALLFLAAIGIDSAVRMSFAGRLQMDRWPFPEVYAVSAIGILAMAMVLVSIMSAGIALPILCAFAVGYVGPAIVQETLLRTLGIRPTNVRQTVDEGERQSPT